MTCAISGRERKIRAIRTVFSDAIGVNIIRYETAELLHLDGSWLAWPDYPIRLYLSEGGMIAVAWSRFDDLWLATDLSVPFSIEEGEVRWVRDSVERINPAAGAVIRSVHLGRGEMSVEGEDVEIWTRLLIEVEGGWLEIFNALDENGYAFHAVMPAGELVRCV
jgi:hypothetical protein